MRFAVKVGALPQLGELIASRNGTNCSYNYKDVIINTFVSYFGISDRCAGRLVDTPSMLHSNIFSYVKDKAPNRQDALVSIL